MKKYLIIIFAGLTIISCDKNQFKQTTETISKADSLITKANEGFKTLDSISKIVNDSAKIRKVILPEIEKHAKEVENVIKNNNINIDSIGKELKKATDKIGSGADAIKKVDSVNNVIKNSNSSIEKIIAVSDAVSKVLKDKKTTPSSEISSTHSSTIENSTQSEPIEQTPQRSVQPIKNYLTAGVEVSNIHDARTELSRLINQHNGKIVNESYSSEEGMTKNTVIGKIPQSQFESFSAQLSSLGEIKNKSIERTGSDFLSDTYHEVTITLMENTLLSKNEDEKFSEKSSSAFMKGFDMLENIFLALLPFWPVFLLAIIALVIYRKFKNKKETEDNRSQVDKQTPPPTEE